MDNNRYPAHLFLPAPVTQYMIFRGSTRKPVGYEGDWPVRGAVYGCQIILDPANGYRWVRPDGFVLPVGCKGFRPTHFKPVAEVWLN